MAEEHFHQLKTISGEYGIELFTILASWLERDGFKYDKETGPIVGMTVGALITYALVSINEVSPEMARAHRDHLLKHLENTKQWL